MNSKIIEEAANQNLIANNLEHFAAVYWHLHNVFLTLLFVMMENHNPISATLTSAFAVHQIWNCMI